MIMLFILLDLLLANLVGIYTYTYLFSVLCLFNSSKYETADNAAIFPSPAAFIY